MIQQAWVSFVAALACGAAVVCGGGRPAENESGAVLFSERQAGCSIVVPADATDAEWRAANLLQATLAKSAGRETWRFPIVRETAAPHAPAIHVGRTRAGEGFLAPAEPPPFDSGVGYRADSAGVSIRSERRDSIELAAAWFLGEVAGAKWFMPGPLGEIVPVHERLALPAGEKSSRPGFVSRNFGGIPGAEGQAWLARNGLEARFEHHHSLAAIFRPEDLRRTPAMAPSRDGQRYFPSSGQNDWQPDLTSSAAAEHAARVLGRAFATDPGRVSASLSVNDSIRFDASPATLNAVAPSRYFRGRPDYSDLVFGFTNAVAERVAREHPDRWITAYAYLWAENAPRFPVARNVVPILTADRAQWFDPEFAAEDRRLLERWSHSGAGFLGAYDYFYGAPFLVPRPTLYAVRESIPAEHRAGVRLFYAEATPNWALDGPKLWLAARLLWQPDADADALLASYYREYWQEAAAPMREFFAACEAAWQSQPRPGYWLKYYRDEHQALLFPPAVRQALRRALEAARRMARTPPVRARVEFVAATFAVSEAFADFCDARTELVRLTRSSPVASVVAGWRTYARARSDFIACEARVRREYPLALAPHDHGIYLRNEPDGRVVRALLATPEGRAALATDAASSLLHGASPQALSELLAGEGTPLRDADWRDVRIGSVQRSIDLEWTGAGAAWQGRGEPCEGRTISLERGEAAERALRFAGCKTDLFSQWTPITPEAVCVAQTQVRARVSPGNSTYLILTFLDENQRHLGLGTIDRIPANAAAETSELCVVARAPRQARWVGIGLCVANQVGADFAEFSAVSLKVK